MYGNSRRLCLGNPRTTPPFGRGSGHNQLDFNYGNQPYTQRISGLINQQEFTGFGFRDNISDLTSNISAPSVYNHVIPLKDADFTKPPPGYPANPPPPHKVKA